MLLITTRKVVKCHWHRQWERVICFFRVACLQWLDLLAVKLHLVLAIFFNWPRLLLLLVLKLVLLLAILFNLLVPVKPIISVSFSKTVFHHLLLPLLTRPLLMIPFKKVPHRHPLSCSLLSIN